MRSRLGFAVAVHVEPDILILDEVLAVGDAVFKRKCFAKMEEFFRAGKTVLFVSHDANAVNKLCTRAVLLHGGKIILDGKPGDVTRYYEKLAHTKQQNQADVLAEIARFQQQPRESLTPAAQVGEASSPSKNSPYYIAELVSKSALAYATARAEILDPHITTPSGERVNVLLSGETYIYCYQVHFLDEANKVAFGMQIKDIHGMRITGASLANDASRLIEHVPAGATLKISWPFNCNLLGGYFFTNAGVSEILDGRSVFLARAVDAMTFRVMPPKNSLTRGIVDLGQTLEVETL
jgi:lipopolysaccharide transport system ATP-binding protein